MYTLLELNSFLQRSVDVAFVIERVAQDEFDIHQMPESMWEVQHRRDRADDVALRLSGVCRGGEDMKFEQSGTGEFA